MRKIYLFFILIILISGQSLYSQDRSAYYDAMALSNEFKSQQAKTPPKLIPSDNPEVLAFLQKYFEPGADISSEIANNKFLSDYFSPTGSSSVVTAANIKSAAGNMLSSVGGLDVTNLAYGLADFLVKRTKEELNVAFFSRFKETLNNPNYADLKVLFPNTCELLDAIGNGIYDYNKYLQNLREAFLSDLVILDENLPGIIPNHEMFFEKHFGLAASLKSACYITSSLKYQIHPGDILDNYPMDFLLKKNGDTVNKNLTGAIQTLQLVSQSLRDTSASSGNYWVNFQKVKELVSNKDAFKIYLGLIYQVAKNERFNNIPYKHGSFVALLDSVNFDKDYVAYKNYISNFAIRANELNELVKKYAKPASDSIAVENYARYFNSSVGLLEYCIKVTSLPHFDKVVKLNLDSALTIVFKITNETSSLATDINRKNYSSAVNHVVTIYNLVRTKPLEADVHELSLKGGGKDEASVQALKKMENASEVSQDLLQKLAQYGAFISTVAAAKNAEEVEKAIEVAALPSGSSRIKRETPFNVSLNGYTGIFFGYEKIIGVKNNTISINNYGITAPIGVAISTGSHSFAFAWPGNEGHWSYSLFISLIDIGAVASFRFQNSDSISQVPTIKLKDIFSPGLFFSIGFPKCPLSLNMGAQVGPNLRNVNGKDDQGNIVNLYQENVYWRFSASLVVDIPIFNFYTQSKR